MKKIWQEEAWEDYLYWQTWDKKLIEKFYKQMFIEYKKLELLRNFSSNFLYSFLNEILLLLKEYKFLTKIIQFLK